VLEVKAVETKHPVMVGVPATWTTPEVDELYRAEKLWDSATVLGVSTSAQVKDERCGDLGSTRWAMFAAFSTSLGHGKQGGGSARVSPDLVGRGLIPGVCGKLGADGKPSAGSGAPKP